MPTARKRRTHERTEAGGSILQGLQEAIAWSAGEDVVVRETTIPIPRVDVRKTKEKIGTS